MKQSFQFKSGYYAKGSSRAPVVTCLRESTVNSAPSLDLCRPSELSVLKNGSSRFPASEKLLGKYRHQLCVDMRTGREGRSAGFKMSAQGLCSRSRPQMSQEVIKRRDATLTLCPDSEKSSRKIQVSSVNSQLFIVLLQISSSVSL